MLKTLKTNLVEEKEEENRLFERNTCLTNRIKKKRKNEILLKSKIYYL